MDSKPNFDFKLRLLILKLVTYSKRLEFKQIRIYVWWVEYVEDPWSMENFKLYSKKILKCPILKKCMVYEISSRKHNEILSRRDIVLVWYITLTKIYQIKANGMNKDWQYEYSKTQC